jgi:cytoplasmic iron level regulating protein YaaA (DUF328/UPF0246 family)
MKAPSARPARDLYQGNLFKLSVAWIERRSHVYPQWAILSAKYGVVMPDDVIEPYNLALQSLPRDEELAWGKRVRQELVNKFGAEKIYTVLAGYDYYAGVRDLPFVDSVFQHWANQRRDEGKRNTGIGILMRELKRDRGYY